MTSADQQAQKEILANTSLEELQSWATLMSQYIWTIETTKPNSPILPEAYQRLADIKEEIEYQSLLLEEIDFEAMDRSHSGKKQRK